MRPASGPAPRASQCRAPALPGPNLALPGAPAPSRPTPARPPPGERAPPHSCGGGRKSVRGQRAGQLASLKKFAALGGVARRGPPLASAVTAGDFLDSSSAGPAPRAGPQSVLGHPRPGPRDTNFL
ncbi:putative uncharacterized protein encoded by LINC00472 [Dasypus novemcinctus]|uniref:putative uncharacterized protein encoded by LINC00472 n=1 Tax=Dasypus novemcinctus TaxID=9361 RepID=UPI0039C9577A